MKKVAIKKLGMVTVGLFVLVIIIAALIANVSIKNERSSLKNIETLKEDFITIETEFCELHYPEIWEEYLNVKLNEENGCVIEVYSIIEDREPIHINDIVIGKGRGSDLGYIKYGEDLLEFKMEYMDLNFDETWEVYETDIIYAMQEDMDYIVTDLKERGILVENE